MTVIWLAVLLIYGLYTSYGSIPPLAWLLLVPFLAQDISDVNKK